MKILVWRAAFYFLMLVLVSLNEIRGDTISAGFQVTVRLSLLLILAFGTLYIILMQYLKSPRLTPEERARLREDRERAKQAIAERVIARLKGGRG